MKRKLFRMLAGPSIMSHVDRMRHRLRYDVPAIWNRAVAAKKQSRQRRLLLDWHHRLETDPPDVLVGANIGVGNGVRHHLEGIRKYSALRVELSPPNDLVANLSYHDFHTTFRAEMMDWRPRRVRAIHSHVYPYFIEWCRKQAGGDALWVHTYHAPYSAEVEGEPLAAWQSEINSALTIDARHADVRISVSRWQQEYLLGEHDISTVHVPNAVDVAMCDVASSEQFRGVANGEQFALYVGRNDGAKNPADIIRLAARLPALRFVMIGAGLTATAVFSRWGLTPTANVIFMGPQSYLEVQHALAAAAVVVVTSRREGLPTLVLEAMTHSKPVVVPNEPGSREALGDEPTRYIYQGGDIEDLEAQLIVALSGPRQIPSYRERVLRLYDWRVVAQTLDGIYTDGVTGG